jgi:CDP-diacylglycerol--glycerol-3-phosphate 3-phosphatidyltransferase/cardiolipin synthase
LDGYYARKLGQTSRLGAFLDPVADKLIVAAALVLIVSADSRWYVVIMAIVIIGREIAVSALREWMAEIGQRGRMKVSVWGKYKTIMQIVGLSMLLFRQHLLGIPIYKLGLVLSAVAAVLTLWSMILYLRLAWPQLRDSSSL